MKSAIAPFEPPPPPASVLPPPQTDPPELTLPLLPLPAPPVVPKLAPLQLDCCPQPSMRNSMPATSIRVRVRVACVIALRELPKTDREFRSGWGPARGSRPREPAVRHGAMVGRKPKCNNVTLV